MTNKTKGNLLVAIQFLLLAVLLFLPKGSNWFISSELGLFANLITFLAVSIFLVSAINLGRSLTANPVPLAEAKLKTKGMYAIVRHPIYLGIILLVIGRVPVAESWLVLIAGALLIALISIKARFEDQLLLAHYPQYALYASKVGRIVPLVGKISTK